MGFLNLPAREREFLENVFKLLRNYGAAVSVLGPDGEAVWAGPSDDLGPVLAHIGQEKKTNVVLMGHCSGCGEWSFLGTMEIRHNIGKRSINKTIRFSDDPALSEFLDAMMAVATAGEAAVPRSARLH